MIELNTFKKILEENEERLPLLTLDEFFDGNTEEDSIAPNQWEFGRPTLSEIRNMLQKIELMPDIAWVRVALHDDTEIVENNGKEELVLAGDTIVICTTILPAELEKLVNCEWLCSDGVITIEAFELNTYSCVPPIPDNFDCLEIVWDSSKTFSLSGEIAKAAEPVNGQDERRTNAPPLTAPPAFADGQSRRESPKMASRPFQF